MLCHVQLAWARAIDLAHRVLRGVGSRSPLSPARVRGPSECFQCFGAALRHWRGSLCAAPWRPPWLAPGPWPSGVPWHPLRLSRLDGHLWRAMRLGWGEAPCRPQFSCSPAAQWRAFRHQVATRSRDLLPPSHPAEMRRLPPLPAAACCRCCRPSPHTLPPASGALQRGRGRRVAAQYTPEQLAFLQRKEGSASPAQVIGMWGAGRPLMLLCAAAAPGNAAYVA